MNLDHLSMALHSLAPAFKNHLWQSTVFSLLAALLALCLRKNYARTRYWIWFAASIKFLIPFSILVTLGGALAPSRQPVGAETPVYNLMYEVSQRFASAPIPGPLVVVAKTTGVQGSTWLQMYPLFLAAIWVIGFVSVLAVWCVYWRRASLAIRTATAIGEGPELSALRCLERSGIVNIPIRLLLSDSSLGPGVYGVTRPILIWPTRVLQQLDEAQIKSILAHEICHVHRRDNLTATIHMLVEAIFWFHPLVWWLGSRLEVELERACDEHVLELTDAPKVYAESILKVCEVSLESHHLCVSEAAGADLKERIRRIMTKRVGREFNLHAQTLVVGGGIWSDCCANCFWASDSQPCRARIVEFICLPTIRREQFAFEAIISAPDGTLRKIWTPSQLLRSCLTFIKPGQSALLRTFLPLLLLGIRHKYYRRELRTVT